MENIKEFLQKLEKHIEELNELKRKIEEQEKKKDEIRKKKEELDDNIKRQKTELYKQEDEIRQKDEELNKEIIKVNVQIGGQVITGVIKNNTINKKHLKIIDLLPNVLTSEMISDIKQIIQSRSLYEGDKQRIETAILVNKYNLSIQRAMELLANYLGITYGTVADKLCRQLKIRMNRTEQLIKNKDAFKKALVDKHPWSEKDINKVFDDIWTK